MGPLGRVGDTVDLWRSRVAARARDRVRDGARDRVHDEHGVSLIELVIACAIFVTLMLGVANTVGGSLDLTRQNRNRSVAANLASQEMDTVRAADFTTLPIGLVNTTSTVDGVPYTVSRETEWTATGATSGPCDAQGGNPTLLRVHIAVSWAVMEGIPPVVSDTVMAPPVGSYDANSGHLAVKVLDRDASAQSGVPVSITAAGFTTRTITTTSDGCAFFAFLPAKTYTITLNKVGYVDRQSVASPTQAVGVTVGNVSSAQFDYDQSSTLQLTLTPTVAATIPAALPVTLGNTQYLPNGTKLFPGSGATRTIVNLFPSLSGYEAFAGSCLDADPEGIQGGGGAYWPSAQRDQALESSPGSSTTGTVRLGVTAATVTRLGLPLVGVTVTATHASDAGCSGGVTYTLGTTDASGQVTAALPYGTWTIKVTGRTVVGSWPIAVIDPALSAAVPVTATVS